MFSMAVFPASSTRAVFVCVLAGGLGGCFQVGGAQKEPPAPTPPAFAPASGSITSKAIITRTLNNANTNATTFSVEPNAPPPIVATQVDPPNGVNGLQRTAVSVGSYGYFVADGMVQSNGSAVTGSAVNSTDTWVSYTNSPGSRLDASLGAPSLQSSYAGVGSIGKRAVGSTGDFVSYAFGMFGGASTTDMPTSGTATYKGTFEGVEQSAVNGGQIQTSNVSGKANLTADFNAKTVRGRIDDVNNHGVGPVKTPAAYSIGYSGSITESSFAGSSWLTQKNSDAPLAGFTQNSGALQGGFFGAGAAEAAGAVGVAASDATKKISVTGGFGAKKQ